MGVDICFFIDHDLPADNPQLFYEEFRKRTNRDVFLHNCDEVPFQNIIHKSDTFYILYSDNYSDISIEYEKDNYLFLLDIYKKTVYVGNTDCDGKTAFNYLRWYQMLDFFRENKKEGHDWLEKSISICKNYLASVFHSTKLIMLADSSSYRHETIVGDFFMEQGKSIEEAVELNKTFSPPCKIWRNEEVFGSPRSDYENDDSDWIEAFFIFDL